jgi:hypothetical protein
MLIDNLFTTTNKEKASMHNNDPNRHMRFFIHGEQIQNKARDCFMGLSLLAICLLCVSFTGGCSGEVQDHNVQFNLAAPVINEKTVSLNGGVAVPVERIQWEWGDGQTDKHHFFPASHTYANPGNYKITVTVFDANNKHASQSVSVEIK